MLHEIPNERSIFGCLVVFLCMYVAVWMGVQYITTLQALCILYSTYYLVPGND